MNKLKISNDELATEWHTLHFLSTQSVMSNNTRQGEFHYFQIGMKECLACGKSCWLLKKDKNKQDEQM
jgi:hypothetical protein